MEELSGKIAELLSDPNTVEQLKRTAEQLFGGDGDGKPAKNDIPAAEFTGISDISEVSRILSMLKTDTKNERTSLLLSLRPLLSEKRQQRCDRAIKILRLLDMLPLLKESGLLEKLL